MQNSLLHTIQKVKENRFLWFSVILTITLIVAFLDNNLPAEVGTSMLYFVPIFLASWYFGLWGGLFFVVLCGFFWTTNQYLLLPAYSSWIIFVWNNFARFTTFLIIAFLVALLKRKMDYTNLLSIMDPLTGAMNTRFFYPYMQIQLDKLARDNIPFTVVFVDIDKFKTINDQFGHQTGDKVLCLLVDNFKENLRKTDVVCRTGGDEFLILLPDIRLETAKTVYSKIKKEFEKKAKANKWPITLSAGIICSASSASSASSVQKIINMADELMYQIKRKGGNDFSAKTFDGVEY